MATENNDTPAFVRISNREVYDKLSQLERTVQSMDERMNAILNENVSLGKRVRALELKVYAVLAGVGSALSAAGIYIVSRMG